MVSYKWENQITLTGVSVLSDSLILSFYSYQIQIYMTLWATCGGRTFKWQSSDFKYHMHVGSQAETKFQIVLSYPQAVDPGFLTLRYHSETLIFAFIMYFIHTIVGPRKRCVPSRIARSTSCIYTYHHRILSRRYEMSPGGYLSIFINILTSTSLHVWLLIPCVQPGLLYWALSRLFFAISWWHAFACNKRFKHLVARMVIVGSHFMLNHCTWTYI